LNKCTIINNKGAKIGKMAIVLSQDEVNQLFASINAVGTKPEDLRPTADSRKIKIYNFKRPDKFSKEQIRAISIIHETFARLATNSLSAQLRSVVNVNVASVDQLTYEEFIRGVPCPTTLAIINMESQPISKGEDSPPVSLKGHSLFEIDPFITFSIIDKICGGFGKIKSQRELTDIEIYIMEGIIVRMLGNIREAWNQVLDFSPRLGQINTNPKFVQIVQPTEMVVLVKMKIKIGDVEGFINICIPNITIEPIIEKLSIWHSINQNNMPLNPLTNFNLNSREDVPVRLTAEILCRNYPINEIWKWNAKTLILPLHHLAKGYCYLKCGDRRVWQCQILPDRKRFSKRITIVDYIENPFGMEGNDMEMDKVNSLITDALSNATMKISVELGTTVKTVKEVFSMSKGTILELDKLAGEPVDVKANGILIATGEIVIIDENFGVRIIEISDTANALSKNESNTSKTSKSTAKESK